MSYQFILESLKIFLTSSLSSHSKTKKRKKQNQTSNIHKYRKNIAVNYIVFPICSKSRCRNVIMINLLNTNTSTIMKIIKTVCT